MVVKKRKIFFSHARDDNKRELEKQSQNENVISSTCMTIKFNTLHSPFNVSIFLHTIHISQFMTNCDVLFNVKRQFVKHLWASTRISFWNCVYFAMMVPRHSYNHVDEQRMSRKEWRETKKIVFRRIKIICEFWRIVQHLIWLSIQQRLTTR